MENTQKNYRLNGHGFQKRNISEDSESLKVGKNLPDILQQFEDLVNHNLIYDSEQDKNLETLLQSGYESEEISAKDESEMEEDYGYNITQYKEGEEEEEEDWYDDDDDDDDDDEGEHEGRG